MLLVDICDMREQRVVDVQLFVDAVEESLAERAAVEVLDSAVEEAHTGANIRVTARVVGCR